MSAPRKPHNLFVVRSSDSSRFRRVVNPEALSAAQRQTAERYIKLAVPQGGGVLVGALVAEAAWDIRPMLLVDGQVLLLRVCDPISAASADKALFMRVLYGRLTTARTPGITSCGEGQGTFWVLRPFATSTLLECLEKGELPCHPHEILSKLLSAVMQYHRQNSLHGHVSLANISVSADELLIQDYGFYVSSSQKLQSPFVAPEILAGSPPSPACDIYSIGVVLKYLLGNSLTTEQQAFIDAMTVSVPEMRPTLSQTWEVFLHTSPPKEKPHNVIKADSPRKLMTGKVIARQIPTESTPKRIEHVIQDVPVMKPGMPPPVISKPPPTADIGATTPESADSNFFLYGLAALAIIFAVIYMWRGEDEQIEYPVSSEYLMLWTSGQPSLMQKVVDAAVLDNDEAAEQTIVRDALNGNNRPQTHANVIRIAYNPAWERDLSAQDRRLILHFSLPYFMSKINEDLPPLGQAHPAIILAILGTLDLEKTKGLGFATPITRLFELPPPYGITFEVLASLGVKDAQEESARSLAHIIVGDASAGTVTKFFNSQDSIEQAQTKLKILVSLFPQQPALSDTVIEAIGQSNTALTEWLLWFAKEELPGWSKGGAGKMFLVMTGETNFDTLTLDQQVDLLSFPNERVRKHAAESLKKALMFTRDRSTVDYLAQGSHKLSRLQVMYLVSALQLPAESSLEFVTRWFEIKPDPQSVAQILIARRNINEIDELNIQGARYLMDTKWELSLEGLKLLGRHSEPLARALAYSRLIPQDPRHRELLKEFALRETEPRLKKDLVRRLAQDKLN